jgi:hypothetical protein
MADQTFDEAYREGWMSVAGEEPLPNNPTRPPAGEVADAAAGFQYGRADALEHFKPGTGTEPPEPTGR